MAMPSRARAQSAIAGVVRDPSGGVLPGVIVEASSTALIEKVRTATTDSSGLYLIVDLRPGVYRVTFALTGFSTMERLGVELAADFTATVNAEMKLGALAETVVVSVAPPVVDARSAVQITRLDRETLDTIPTGQNVWEMAQLISGIDVYNASALHTGTVGGQGGAVQAYMSVHGMSAAQNVVMVDGMTVSGLEANGSVQGYFNNDLNQEVSFQTSGINADRSGGGVTVNMIPREGGNRFSGDFKLSYRPGQWIGDNFTQRLKDMGMQYKGTLEYLSDVTISEGGPVTRGALWFFTSYHQFNTSNIVPDTLFDDGRQGTDQQHIRQGSLRLTGQLAPRHKISGYYDRVDKLRAHIMVAQTDPETAAVRQTSPNYATGQIKLTSTLSNRLLFEGGYSMNREFRNELAQDGILKAPGTPEWYAGASRTLQTGGSARTTSPALPGQDWPARDNLQASLTYVTGSHNVKVGGQYQWGRFFHSNTANADSTQRYANVARVGNEWVFSNPADVVVRNTPIASVDRLNRDVGIYGQDSWRLKRMTVNAGLRWEHVNAQNDAYSVPAGRFTPARSIPAVKNVPDWFDLAPRFSVVYDVFGDGKTAVKYAANRYNRAAATSLAYAFNRLTSATRTLPWTDLNRDDLAQGQPVFNPDGTATFCQYLTPGCEIDLSALRSTTGALFGTPEDADPYQPYERPWRLEQSVELEHQLLSRLSLTASWFHGTDHDLTKTVNPYRQDGDDVPVTIYNPIDGTPITIYSLRDVAARARLAQSGNRVTYTEPLRKSVYNELSLAFRTRPYRGAQIFGGLTAARDDDVDCASSRYVVDPNTLRFCDRNHLPEGQGVPLAVDFRVGASFPLHRGVTLGLSYRNNDEGSFTPTYAIVPGTGPNATRYPDGAPTSPRKVAGEPAPPCPTQYGCVPGALVLPGFLLPTGSTSVLVSLVPPGHIRRERLQQVDLKLSKTLKVRSLRVLPTVDVFNLFNSDKIFQYQAVTYANTAGTYLVPSEILLGRVVSVGAMVRW